MGKLQVKLLLVVASFCSWEEGFWSQELSAENYSQAVKFIPKENKQKTEDVSSGFSNARHKKVEKYADISHHPCAYRIPILS